MGGSGAGYECGDLPWNKGQGLFASCGLNLIQILANLSNFRKEQFNILVHNNCMDKISELLKCLNDSYMPCFFAVAVTFNWNCGVFISFKPEVCTNFWPLVTPHFLGVDLATRCLYFCFLNLFIVARDTLLGCSVFCYLRA